MAGRRKEMHATYVATKTNSHRARAGLCEYFSSQLCYFVWTASGPYKIGGLRYGIIFIDHFDSEALAG
jgi:hypothetical protein